MTTFNWKILKVFGNDENITEVHFLLKAQNKQILSKLKAIIVSLKEQLLNLIQKLKKKI